MTSPFSDTRITFRAYSYSLAAVGLVTSILTVLGFALVSSLRHLLWVRMMKGHPMPPVWLWIGVVTLAITILVLWYRVIAAALFQHQQTKTFIHRVQPLLKPLPTTLHPKLLEIADWYLVEDKKDRYAFTWGIKRAHVAISQGLWEVLDESAQTAVLFHEAAHVLARDPLQQMFLRVLAVALRPFGAASLYHRYLLRREMLADELAISACEGDDVPLLTALLAASESPGANESRVGLAGSLEARITFMETGQLPGWWDKKLRYRLLSTGAAVALTVGEGLLVWCH